MNIESNILKIRRIYADHLSTFINHNKRIMFLKLDTDPLRLYARTRSTHLKDMVCIVVLYTYILVLTVNE